MYAGLFAIVKLYVETPRRVVNISVSVNPGEYMNPEAIAAAVKAAGGEVK